MRVIEFRGKRLDNGEWVYGDLETQRAKGKSLIHTYNEDGSYNRAFEIEPDTIGQFYKTHYILKLKSMKAIYEGDIVKGYQPYNDDKQHVCKVFWDSTTAGFRLLTDNNHIEDLVVFTVTDYLGNCYDNPEWQKGGVK